MRNWVKRSLTMFMVALMCVGTVMTAQAAWKQSSGTWYYEMNNGKNATGWQQIDSIWYYFNGNGQMMTGWQQIGGDWYYMRSSGAMVANQWVGNYYLGSSGAMLKNRWVGPYYVGADGAWIPNYGETLELDGIYSIGGMNDDVPALQFNPDTGTVQMWNFDIFSLSEQEGLYWTATYYVVDGGIEISRPYGYEYFEVYANEDGITISKDGDACFFEAYPGN